MKCIAESTTFMQLQNVIHYTGYVGMTLLRGHAQQGMAHLVRAVCMGVVVGVPLQPEDDRVGEEPVAIPGVLRCRPLHTAVPQWPQLSVQSQEAAHMPRLTQHLLPQAGNAARPETGMSRAALRFALAVQVTDDADSSTDGCKVEAARLPVLVRARCSP